jgi:hypothetical protein
VNHNGVHKSKELCLHSLTCIVIVAITLTKQSYHSYGSYTLGQVLAMLGWFSDPTPTCRSGMSGWFSYPTPTCRSDMSGWFSDPTPTSRSDMSGWFSDPTPTCRSDMSGWFSYCFCLAGKKKLSGVELDTCLRFNWKIRAARLIG